MFKIVEHNGNGINTVESDLHSRDEAEIALFECMTKNPKAVYTIEDDETTIIVENRYANLE